MVDMERRTVLKAVGSTGAVLALGVGTAAAAGEGKREGASAGQTIYDIVENDPAFSTLKGALDATGLDEVLDAEGKQYTVFAPTNDAFDQITVPGDLDVLTDVLLYHVTNGRRYAASVVNAPQLKMLNGGTVTVDGTTLNDGQASIVGTDVEASNGVVHVLDGVLLP